jgi:hypothetical protein
MTPTHCELGPAGNCTRGWLASDPRFDFLCFRRLRPVFVGADCGGCGACEGAFTGVSAEGATMLPECDMIAGLGNYRIDTETSNMEG